MYVCVFVDVNESEKHMHCATCCMLMYMWT